MDFFKRSKIMKILDLDHNHVAEMSIFFGQNSESRLYHIIKVSQRRFLDSNVRKSCCVTADGVNEHVVPELVLSTPVSAGKPDFRNFEYAEEAEDRAAAG